MSLSPFNRILTYFLVGATTLTVFFLFPPVGYPEGLSSTLTSRAIERALIRGHAGSLIVALLPVAIATGLLNEAMRRAAAYVGWRLAAEVIAAFERMGFANPPPAPRSWDGEAEPTQAVSLYSSLMRHISASVRDRFSDIDQRKAMIVVRHALEDRVVSCRISINSALLGQFWLARFLLLSNDWKMAKGLLNSCLQMAYSKYVCSDQGAFDLTEAQCFRRLKVGMEELHRLRGEKSTRRITDAIRAAEQRVEESVSVDDDLDGFAMAVFAWSASEVVIQRWVRIRGAYNLAMGFSLVAVVWASMRFVSMPQFDMAVLLALGAGLCLARYGEFLKLLSVRYVARTAMLEIARSSPHPALSGIRWITVRG